MYMIIIKFILKTHYFCVIDFTVSKFNYGLRFITMCDL